MSAETTSTTTADAPDPRRLLLLGIAAYPRSLTEPQRFGQTPTNPGSGELKYMCTLIATGKAAVRMDEVVNAAAGAAAKRAYPDRKSYPARGLRGIETQPLIKSVLPGYATMWKDAPRDALFVRLSSFDPPGFVWPDMSLMTLEDAKRTIVAGAIIKVTGLAMWFPGGDGKGDPGIRLNLHNIQYVKPGPKLFEGKRQAGEDFDPADDSEDELLDLDV